LLFSWDVGLGSFSRIVGIFPFSPKWWARRRESLADFLVVGRPVMEARNPREAAEAIIAEIAIAGS
jgi:hypothetical protein